jgi:hypothetical protein
MCRWCHSCIVKWVWVEQSLFIVVMTLILVDFLSVKLDCTAGVCLPLS